MNTISFVSDNDKKIFRNKILSCSLNKDIGFNIIIKEILNEKYKYEVLKYTTLAVVLINLIFEYTDDITRLDMTVFRSGFNKVLSIRIILDNCVLRVGYTITNNNKLLPMTVHLINFNKLICKCIMVIPNYTNNDIYNQLITYNKCPTLAEYDICHFANTYITDKYSINQYFNINKQYSCKESPIIYNKYSMILNKTHLRYLMVIEDTYQFERIILIAKLFYDLDL